MVWTPNLLAIAGSDPSGGAGIAADLKTFTRWGGYGCFVLTALTAQNTVGVQAVLPVPADFVAAQLASVLDDVHLDAVKIGMLGDVRVAHAVDEVLRERLAGTPVVLDPVMVATSGDSLGGDGVLEALREMLPRATVVTPNLPEAAALSGQPEAESLDEMRAQGEVLLGMGASAVLVKGGHLAGDRMTDLLVTADGTHELRAPRVTTRNTHGTGCTLSSAIAAALGHGLPLARAVEVAKDWLTEALRHADELEVGGLQDGDRRDGVGRPGVGHGPVNHLVGLPQHALDGIRQALA